MVWCKLDLGRLIVGHLQAGFWSFGSLLGLRQALIITKNSDIHYFLLLIPRNPSSKFIKGFSGVLKWILTQTVKIWPFSGQISSVFGACQAPQVSFTQYFLLQTLQKPSCEYRRTYNCGLKEIWTRTVDIKGRRKLVPYYIYV